MGKYLSWLGRTRVSTWKGSTSNSLRFGASKSNHQFESALSWIYVGLTVGILVGGAGLDRGGDVGSFERDPLQNSIPSLSAVQQSAGRGVSGWEAASGNEKSLLGPNSEPNPRSG